jgi:hypothetical protein
MKPSCAARRFEMAKNKRTKWTQGIELDEFRRIQERKIRERYGNGIVIWEPGTKYGELNEDLLILNRECGCPRRMRPQFIIVCRRSGRRSSFTLEHDE